MTRVSIWMIGFACLLGLGSALSMTGYAIEGWGDGFPKPLLLALGGAALVQVFASLWLVWKRSLKACIGFVVVAAMLAAVEFGTFSGVFFARDFLSTGAVLMGVASAGLLRNLNRREEIEFTT